jgi:hypothetical protein
MRLRRYTIQNIILVTNSGIPLPMRPKCSSCKIKRYPRFSKSIIFLIFLLKANCWMSRMGEFYIFEKHLWLFIQRGGECGRKLKQNKIATGIIHRYLMSKLSLHVFYLWRHVLSTAPPFILWWSNLEILFAPLHRSSPFIRELRFQAIQTEHGPYMTERTQKAVYIVRCLWHHTVHRRRHHSTPY